MTAANGYWLRKSVRVGVDGDGPDLEPLSVCGHQAEVDLDGSILVDEELVQAVAVLSVLGLGGRLNAHSKIELSVKILHARADVCGSIVQSRVHLGLHFVVVADLVLLDGNVHGWEFRLLVKLIVGNDNVLGSEIGQDLAVHESAATLNLLLGNR